MEPVKRKRRDKRREWGGPYTYNGKARVPRNAGFDTLVQHERNSQRADNRFILFYKFEKELDSESKSHFSLFARRKSLYYDKKKSIMERKEQQFKNDNPTKRISWLSCGSSSIRDEKSTQTVPDDDDDYIVIVIIVMVVLYLIF